MIARYNILIIITVKTLQTKANSLHKMMQTVLQFQLHLQINMVHSLITAVCHILFCEKSKSMHLPTYNSSIPVHKTSKSAWTKKSHSMKMICSGKIYLV